jgi:ferredoxin-NADP reductase
MMSMVRYIRDLCIPAQCTLIYCVRSESDLVFHAELAAAQMNGVHYVPVVSKASAAWAGWKGRLRREILQAEVEKPIESTYFLCGPTGLMELGRTLLQELSVQSSHILQESFGDQGAKTQPEASDARSVTVTFARSGSAMAASCRRTLLETAETSGISIPFGCRQGDCGTCMTRLLRGNVQMLEATALGDKQRSQGFILPCISKPLDDVTIDA